MSAEGFVDMNGRFVSVEDRICIAAVYIVKGTTPDQTGVDVEINPGVFEVPVLRERLPIDLRKIAKQIENYKPGEAR